MAVLHKGRKKLVSEKQEAGGGGRGGTAPDRCGPAVHGRRGALMEETTWFFNWVGGGYNSVWARTKREALEKARKLAVGFVPDERTMVRDPERKRVNAEDARYAGMFD